MSVNLTKKTTNTTKDIIKDAKRRTLTKSVFDTKLNKSIEFSVSDSKAVKKYSDETRYKANKNTIDYRTKDEYNKIQKALCESLKLTKDTNLIECANELFTNFYTSISKSVFMLNTHDIVLNRAKTLEIFLTEESYNKVKQAFTTSVITCRKNKYKVNRMTFDVSKEYKEELLKRVNELDETKIAIATEYINNYDSCFSVQLSTREEIEKFLELVKK